MTTIVGKDHKALRQKSVEVPPKDIASARIQRIIDEMKKALESQPDGVAIAAPQIGENLRIFVISKRVFIIENGHTEEELQDEILHYDDLVFINPVLKRLSRKKEWLEEGCLSVRWLYGHVLRSLKASITAYNERGEKITRGASGLLAQIFQHESDHLDGTLFIDKARDIREVHPDDIAS